MTPVAPVEFWHAVIEDKQMGPLPTDLDPGLIRPALAKEVRPGDLVVGHIDGSPRRRWAWTGAPGEVCYRALPQQDPRSPRAVSLTGRLSSAIDIEDEVLIVPATLYPAHYRPGTRVERMAVHYQPYARQWEQRGTVRTVDDADGTLTVQWDGGADTFRTTRDLIRPVDPDDVDYDRRTYGFTAGDRVRSQDGRTGALLEIYRPGWSTHHGRVQWDGGVEKPGESDEPVTELTRAPVELIADWLSLPQG
ncbi:DUF4314 domain-containing protein [Streptomyces sp. NPDC017230]|uniref:DUF4314 domain-containing protein n=1 Tax=unclassified Streptomyces TaxID=2593676 RepID=UPI0037B62398